MTCKQLSNKKRTDALKLFFLFFSIIFFCVEAARDAAPPLNISHNAHCNGIRNKGTDLGTFATSSRVAASPKQLLPLRFSVATYYPPAAVSRGLGLEATNWDLVAWALNSRRDKTTPHRPLMTLGAITLHLQLLCPCVVAWSRSLKYSQSTLSSNCEPFF